MKTKVKIILSVFLLISAPIVFIEIFARVSYEVFSKLLYVILPEQIFTNISFKYNPVKNFVLKEGIIQHDKYCGYTLKPNKNITLKSPEYKVEVTLISLPGTGIGIRDRNYDLQNKEVFGIAVGDSYTFCTGLEIEKCWTEVLEDKIGRIILNLGVFGYGAIQKYNMLLNYGIKFKPKIILWQHNFTDYKDDKYYTLGEQFPIPHPLNMFSKQNFFFSNIFIFSFFSGLIENINLKERAIEFFTKLPDKEEIFRTTNYIQKAYELSRKINADFFIIFAGKDNIAERILCRTINCVIPTLIENRHYFLEMHLNEEGNKILAEEVLKAIRKLEKN